MKLKQILIVLLVPNFLFAQLHINDLKFLSGKWKAVSNNITYTDVWDFDYEKNMLKGWGIKQKKGVTDTFESLKLYQLGNDLFYSVIEKNNKKTSQVSFKLDSNAEKSFTFINHENDYPTSITYHLIHIDSVVVELNDKENNPENKMTFNFSRVNEYEHFSANLNGINVEMRKYFLCLLKKGNNRNQNEEETAKIQAKHLQHITEMAQLNKISLAGPTDSKNTDLSGIMVYNTATQAEAEYLQSKDAAVISGRLFVEIVPWFSKEGATLSTK